MADVKAPPAGLLSGLKILLVDDDEDCRQFIALALQEEGVDLVEAPDAEQAVEALKKKTFDLVATDKNLPEMDGIGLIQHIRQTYGSLPVILITGYGSIGSAVEALKLGAQDYLVKPIEDTDLLFRSIRNAVEQHRLSLENKRLQERLNRAQRMESVGILAGGVAHQLNNTLEPIVGLPSIIGEQLDAIWTAAGLVTSKGEEVQHPSPAIQNRIGQVEMDLTVLKSSAGQVHAIKEQLQNIEASGRRAAAVVKDLLAFSDSEHHSKELQDFNALIHRTLNCPEVMEMRLRLPSLRLQTELQPALPKVAGSGSHLERAIINLLRNAIQAIDRRPAGEAFDPVVVVKTSAIKTDKRTVAYEVIDPGDYVVFEISDSGIGMTPQTMERVIEPFFTTRELSGTGGHGMGLSIIYRVVKDHGGYLDIVSQPGKGATFKLFLPASGAPEPSSAPAAAPAGGVHVLLVDDDENVRRVTKALLTRLAYRVTLASNGHEAVEILQDALNRGESLPFDVVMLDMVMEEGFDGLTTFEELVRLCPDLRVIAASGYAPTDRVQTMIDRGAGWLAKPFSLQELTKAIDDKLNKPAR